jgi:2-dehydro-3-deoxygluconokinase
MRHFIMQATSAETNVASVASYLGLPVKVLTTFVKGSPIARSSRTTSPRRHMSVRGPEVPQGGPWGYRHQFNLADSGFGARGPRVHNDRAGEVGRTLNVKDFDLERIFGNEGVQIVHLSGLIAALSPETSTFCLELRPRRQARHAHLLRPQPPRLVLEGAREGTARHLRRDRRLSDILVGNEEDFQLCLGIEGPEAGGKDIWPPRSTASRA